MSFAVRNEHAEHEPFAPARVAAHPSAGTTAAGYFAWKDVVGRVVALVLLVVGLPIIVLAALAVKLTSPGPAIYRQVRVGRKGRLFTMYKIRTMRVDAEAVTGPVWTRTRDPRVTRLGRVMRWLHIDEFPQLINVLRGEMALIGPRPERPEFTQMLARQLPAYEDRLLVRPGITGLAQINLPPDTDLESVRRKLSLDLVYVREGTLWLDARIFACTFARLAGLHGPRVAHVFGVARRPEEGPEPVWHRSNGHHADVTRRNGKGGLIHAGQAAVAQVCGAAFDRSTTEVDDAEFDDLSLPRVPR